MHVTSVTFFPEAGDPTFLKGFFFLYNSPFHNLQCQCILKLLFWQYLGLAMTLNLVRVPGHRKLPSITLVLKPAPILEPKTLPRRSISKLIDTYTALTFSSVAISSLLTSALLNNESVRPSSHQQIDQVCQQPRNLFS